MQEVVFKKARDGEATCAIGPILLHSSYNPKKEAEQFVKNISCDFSPSVIILLESALSYCVPPLRVRFPDVKIAGVRYTTAFDNYNGAFDKVFYYTAQNAISFEDAMLKSFTAEELCSTLYLQWGATVKTYPTESSLIKKSIKSITEKAKALVVTKSFFSQKWLLNTLTFCKNAQLLTQLAPITKPLVITASGQSLIDFIPTLKKLHDKCFIVALSSSVTPLLYNGITPNLIVTTDGGYYAKKHLYPLIVVKNIPILCPVSAALPKSIFKTNPIIPVTYGDDLSSTLIKIWSTKINFNILQNSPAPTVAGFAVELFSKINSQNIFMAGLDLSINKQGHDHAQPNILNIDKESKTSRLNTITTSHTKSIFSGYSLSVYRDWFSALPNNITKRLFRIIDNNTNGHIPNIKDITSDEFFNNFSNYEKITATSNTKTITLKARNIKECIFDLYEYIKNICNSDKWLSETQPLKFLQYKKTYNCNERNKKYEELKSQNKIFLSKIKATLEIQN